MLRELKYRFDSRDFFDLQESGSISETDLEKILTWKIRNHHKLKDIYSRVDSPSFIIANPSFLPQHLFKRKLSELSSLHTYNWIGHFNRHGSHEIAFPSQVKREYEFRQVGIVWGDKVHYQDFKTSLWSDSGHFDYQKHANRVPLYCDVDKNTLLEMMESIYGKPKEYPKFR